MWLCWLRCWQKRLLALETKQCALALHLSFPTASTACSWAVLQMHLSAR